MADSYRAVALFLRRCQYRCRLLHHKSQHHQLAIHWLPLRLRRRFPSHNLDSTYRRPPPRDHHSFHFHPTRELDPLCWHTHLTSQLWPYHVRSDPHRSGAAIRPLSTDSIFRPLVHAPRPCFRYGDRLARKPFRRRAGTTHQSIPGKQSV